MGAPKPRTPEIVAEVLANLRLGLHRAVVARLVGVSPRTLRQWRHDDKAFEARCLQAEALAEKTVLAEILGSNEAQDRRNKMHWLAMRYPRRYRTEQVQRVKHSFEAMSDEELARKRDELWQRYQQEMRDGDGRADESLPH